MKRLSQEQQRALLNSLSSSKKAHIKKICRTCEQRGEGIKDMIKKVGSFLGDLAKEVGPTVLKEFIIPLLLKKAKEKYGLDPSGNGLSLAGGGLKLAGQGKKSSPWIAHIKKVAKEQNLSYKEAMKVAAKTYKTK